MSSAAATSLISTPDRLLSFTAVALNRSPYLATLRGPALATTHLQAVSPRCQLIRGNLGVGPRAVVRWHAFWNPTHAHSGWMFASFTTFAQRGISARISAANDSGVPPPISLP